MVRRVVSCLRYQRKRVRRARPLAVVMLAAAALRDLGGVPDVVTPALGRANHPDADILVSFPGIGPVLVEQPARDQPARFPVLLPARATAQQAAVDPL